MIPLSFPDALFPMEELAAHLPKLRDMGYVAVELSWIAYGETKHASFTRQLVGTARAEGPRKSPGHRS